MKIQVFMPKTGRHLRYKSQLTMALGVALLVLITESDVWAQSARRGNVAQAGQFVNNGQTYQVMQASQVPTAADRPGSIGAAINGEYPVQQVGCQSCGTSCGGACGGYTAHGDTLDGYAAMGYGSNNACGIPCDPYCYVRVEGLYMQRDDENHTLSRNLRLPDFDFEWGSRITVGSLPNCVNGYEVTYVGALEWTTAAAVTGGNGQFGTIFGPAVPLPNAALTQAELIQALDRNELLANLPGAEGHDNQFESLRAEFWSLEANRTLVGWDVAKILLGGRYIEYDEDSLFRSTAPTNVVVASSTENKMIGAQVGLDLLYPIGVFAYSDFRARAGVYYNQSESVVSNFAGGSLFDDSGDLASVFELGSGVRYQVGEMLSLRAGTELWYIGGVASANDQYRQLRFDTLNQVIRTEIDNDQDILVYGFNFAAELKY